MYCGLDFIYLLLLLLIVVLIIVCVLSNCRALANNNGLGSNASKFPLGCCTTTVGSPLTAHTILAPLSTGRGSYLYVCIYYYVIILICIFILVIIVLLLMWVLVLC